jgi:hypothetical protein
MLDHILSKSALYSTNKLRQFRPENSSSISSSTPAEKPSLYPQDHPSPSNSPPKRGQLAEEVLVCATANEDGPPRREKTLPSERIGLSGRPGIVTSGEWPKTKNIGGLIQILSKDGVLTQLGKRAEQEQSAQSAATKATSEEEGERVVVADSAEEPWEVLCNSNYRFIYSR